MANLRGNEASLVKYKSKWRSGKTQTIRVPIAIADRVLEAARIIDSGDSLNTVTSDSGFDGDDIENILKSIFAAPSNKGGQIKELVAELGNAIGFKIEKQGRKWIITDTSV